MAETRDRPDQPSADRNLAGEQVGNFRLLRRLGRGAMADVYLSEQCLLRRQVAVKILKPDLAEDQTYLRRFEREAQAAASLVHANIVQIHEVGHEGNLHFIAQEYVQGQNLREWIKRNGPPDLPHALSVMRQVASALAKAASQGVVHRDIKPENIMLTPTGEVKVADFGLARIAREGEALDLTRIGITMGTPLYMSPEQVEGRPLDHRSDLYSFGVTCYHMLSGSPPFEGETALGVAVQHLKKQPAPLENLRPDLPPALCRLVHWMLAKDPDRRCQSALELLRELRRLHLEHFGDNWPEDLPGWETVGVELTADPRRQLTQQLGGLMKTPGTVAARRRAWLAFSASLVGVSLLGAAIAWTTRSPYLLAGVAEQQPTVARKPTALQQYLYASAIDTELAWKGVIVHYPESDFVPRAEQELAWIYLVKKGDYDRAMTIFEKYSAEDQRDEALRAFGLAGQYLILTLQDETDHTRLGDILARLEPVRTRLDWQTLTWVSLATQTNSSKLDEETRQNWADFFQKLNAAGLPQEQSPQGGFSDGISPGTSPGAGFSPGD